MLSARMFFDYKYLLEYVNEKHILKDNIVNIIYTGASYVIFFFEDT